MLYPTPIAKLIDSFSKLPGIGAKTATRLAFYTIKKEQTNINRNVDLKTKNKIDIQIKSKLDEISQFLIKMKKH